MHIKSLQVLIVFCIALLYEAGCDAWLKVAPHFETTLPASRRNPVEITPTLPAAERLLVLESLPAAFDLRIEILARRSLPSASENERRLWAKAALETAERARGRVGAETRGPECL